MMATNLRDIRAYDEKLYKDILELIKMRNYSLYALIEQDLLPLKIWGFTISHRKIESGGKSVSSFIATCSRRRKGQRAISAQVYLGQNKLDIAAIKRAILAYLSSQPEVAKALQLDIKKLEDDA